MISLAYQALYRTYRPSHFTEMAGQKHILRTLNNAVMQNKMAHAYLFTGPRGTGKTSVARILAKAVNCTSTSTDNKPCNQCENCINIQTGTHPDIIEIDAASNNGVDEVRDLIEKVKYAPMHGRFKVYIIDEVHMMSTGAFNALLKTLEEPPEHVLFILATTEPHKVLPTIISRCQRFDFNKIPDVEIQELIREVTAKENVQVDEDTIRLISNLADGGVRDALSILDQCIAYAGNNIDITIINEVYGITTITEKLNLLRYVKEKNIKTLLEQIHHFIDNGIDVKRLCINLIEVLKESLIYQMTQSGELLVLLKENEASILNEMFDAKQTLAMIDDLMDCQDKFRFASNVASYFELALLKMASYDQSADSIQVNDVSAIANVAAKTQYNDTTPVTMDNMKQSQKKKKVAKEWSINDVLNLLVQGSKEDKNKVTELFGMIESTSFSEGFQKEINWLKDGQIVASGKDFILMSFKHQFVADMINDEANQDNFTALMDAMFSQPRLLAAITEDMRTNAINEFVRLRGLNELPKAVSISIPVKKKGSHLVETKITNEVEMKLQQICGDILEIVED